MRTHHTRRPAYSLIETVVVVGAVTIVVGLCGTTLHALLKLDRAGRFAMNDATTVNRLAEQFRDDARRARSIKLEPAPDQKNASRLTLSGDDSAAIVYETKGRRLMRTSSQADGSVRREGYQVERLGPVTFQQDGPIARLTLERAGTPASLVRHAAIRVEAILGKDHARKEAKP